MCKKHLADPEYDIDDFNRSLRELSEIGINPVTIPREWGIKHIPNLMRVYKQIESD